MHMKKLLLICIFLFGCISIHSQKIIVTGSVEDSVTKEKLPFIKVQLLNSSDTLSIQTDLEGEFQFENLDSGTYSLMVNYVGYSIYDSSFKLNKTNRNFDVYLDLDTNRNWVQISNKNFGINKYKAKKDIKNGLLYLYLPGGFVGSPELNGDKLFQEKYEIIFLSQGCVRSFYDNEKEYNTVVFSYLDKTYGKEWRSSIRKDVIGFIKK